MKRELLILTALCLVLAGLPGSSQGATIYRWVDAEGTVHYGETPPNGVDASPVEGDRLSTVPVPRKPGKAAADGEDTAPGAEAGDGAALPEQPPKSIAQQRREERAAARAKARAEQQQIELQCQAMREQLAWVEPNPRVIVKDENGEPRRLGDDERLELVNQAKEYIEENCP